MLSWRSDPMTLEILSGRIVHTSTFVLEQNNVILGHGGRNDAPESYKVFAQVTYPKNGFTVARTKLYCPIYTNQLFNTK